ncbi:MAG: thiopurine S-methyltransferase [Alcaligenaceae bacterium]|nr:thiopurine S-methyltransferase [Alcaligenaceae bacterium]
MDPSFWLERWREGRTGFHQARVTPLLAKYWPLLNLPKGSRVLVPLCGKTIDMCWLAGQGYEVVGVELSPLATADFFTDKNLDAQVESCGELQRYTCEGIEILCGDIFKVDPTVFAGCSAVYDRAALVALPDSLQRSYTAHVYGNLPVNYAGLLITIDYPQHEMDGPPFATGTERVRTLFEPTHQVDLIDQRDTLEKDQKLRDRGVTKLDSLVFRLGRAATTAVRI